MDISRSNTKRNTELSHGYGSCAVQESNFQDIFFGKFGPCASSQVLRSFDCFKVVGVNAPPVSAEVVEFEPFRDGASVSLIDDSMSARGPSPFELDLTIPFAVDAPLPVPASSLLVHDVFDGGQSEVMSGQVPDELTFDGSVSSLTSFGSRNGFATPTHAQSGWIGHSYGGLNQCGTVLEGAGSATDGVNSFEFNSTVSASRQIRSNLKRSPVLRSARKATNRVRIPTQVLAAINTSPVRIQGHSDDLLSRSDGATPTAAPTARGLFVSNFSTLKGTTSGTGT